MLWTPVLKPLHYLTDARIGALVDTELTSDGQEYVKNAIKKAFHNPRSLGVASVALEVWSEAFNLGKLQNAHNAKLLTFWVRIVLSADIHGSVKMTKSVYGEPITHVTELDGHKVITTWRLTLNGAKQVASDLKADGANFTRTFQDGTDCLGGKYRIVGYFRKGD